MVVVECMVEGGDGGRRWSKVMEVVHGGYWR